MMSKSTNSILLVTLVAVLALAAGIIMRGGDKPSEAPSLEKIVVLPTSKPLIDFNFTDHLGQPFNSNHLENHWSIVFFGFTHCPDICPTTMHTLKQVKGQLRSDKKWGNHQVIMVTVDPKRDSLEKLNAYVPFFDPEFIGLRGDLKTTTEFAKQLGILFVSRPADDEGRYDVDHSAALILINPQGEMAGVIPAPHDADEIARDLARLADFHSADHIRSDISGEPASTTTPHVDRKLADRTANKSIAPITLRVENAWIRPAPPAAESMAAYMELFNEGDTPISIASVESSLFNMTMLHDSLVENGVSRMQHRDELVIPANGYYALSPGATHLMLVGTEALPNVGDFVDITIVTSGAQKLSLNVEVRDPPKLN